jgi:uncharacterized protein (TIGR02186 family)
MRFLVLTCALLWAPLCAHSAEEVVAALSQNRVSITANFDGSEILIFGAIKREETIPTDSELDVIVTVSGPEHVEVIREKGRRLGIWINVDSQVLGHAPTFYTVSTTRPVADVITDHTDALWKITTEQRILPNLKNHPSREALLRLRRADGQYAQKESGVVLEGDTLFSTSVALPANLVEGTYTTRILLVRAGKVVDDYSTEIKVHKVGIERWLYNLAHNNALLYGLLSLLLATVAGWGASEVFRRLKR